MHALLTPAPLALAARTSEAHRTRGAAERWILALAVTLVSLGSGGGAGAAVVVQDSFTEASNVAITSHTPDTGTSWTEVFDGSTATTNAQIIAATDVVQGGSSENNVGQAYTAQPAPTSVSQDLSITIRTLETDSGTKPFGLFGRRTDNSNFYHVQVLPNSHAQASIMLYKFVGATATQLGTFDATLAVGTVIKLEIRDAAKKVYVDTVERISSADNALTAAGTWGVYFGSFNGAGVGGHLRPTWEVDDFLAEDAAGGGSTTVTFQDGVSPTVGYNGTLDTWIDSAATSTNYGAADPLLVDGDPDYGALMRFDLSAIPNGSLVLAASLEVDVTNESTDDFHAYEVLRNWNVNQATWNVYTTGNNWTTAGAQGVGSDRSGTSLGILNGAVGKRTMTFNTSGLAVIQKWINTPSTNFGFTIQNYTGGSNGLDFSSEDDATPSNRPKLTVQYRARRLMIVQ